MSHHSHPPMFEGLPILTSAQALEAHLENPSPTAAWICLSPSLLPGVFLLERARHRPDALGELCVALELMLQAMRDGDAAQLLYGYLQLAPQLPGLYAQALVQARHGGSNDGEGGSSSPASPRHARPAQTVPERPLPHFQEGLRPYVLELDEDDEEG